MADDPARISRDARGSIPPPPRSLSEGGLPSTPPPSPLGVGAVESEPDPPLVELHHSLASGRQLVLVLTAAEAEVRAAAASHTQRLLRLRASALTGVSTSEVRIVAARRADEGELADLLAQALAVTLDTTRVGQVADQLADRIRRGQTSVVVCLDEPALRPGSWVAMVLKEIVAALAPADARASVAPPFARLVLVGPPNCPVLTALGLEAIALGSTLDSREAWTWLDSVSKTIGRAVAGTQPTLPQLERAVSSARLRDAIAEVPSLAQLEAEIAEPKPIARAIEDESSPWTWLRRATAALGKGEHDEADRAIAKAEERADDSDARRDLGRRWAEAIEPLLPRDGLTHARSATSRALSSADADEAVRWAKIAVRLGELATVGDGESALLLEAQGRALIAKGDLVMARAVLARARERALAGNLDAQAVASIAVETAEAAYEAGDLASSESEAKRAISTLGATDRVRLRARNVLGKILLAKGLWDEADAHFAGDANNAAEIGDRLAELRALLNRAIAQMCADKLDESERILEAVLESGRALNEPRSQALALENLAVIAQSRRDYGGALERYREAIAGLKRIGQARMLASTAHNLGLLYLRLGDVHQATTIARYAATLFRRGLSAPVVAEGDELRARIAQRMGRSEEALAAISRARELYRAAGHPTRVADCDRFETRLALDDGDVRGARLALDRSKGHDDSPAGRAEQALLEAEWLRANGADASEVMIAAREALALCRASTEEDLIIEAHLLIAEVARVVGDRELLQRHLEGAGGVRDAMLRSIPESYHALFLARPDMIRVAKLERLVESEPIPAITPAVTSESAGARVRSISTPAEPRRIIGTDTALRSLMSAVRRVAQSDTTVLIHGESGTGKELVAEALHFASDRATGPLVKVNCAALVETLLLSELFGHEKGAFTGAVARRRGRFELADGGTLFLDEIGDISPRTQVALLRVLQEKTFERVGGTTPIRVDTRIVCATHRDLATMVTRGEFREDLFYRLRGVQLEVPPLRARLADMGELCAHVLKRISAEHGGPARGVSRDAVELLQAHKWPGNIRELENVLRAVALLADGPEITAQDLTEHVDVLKALEPIVPSSRGPVSVPLSGEVEGEPEEDGGTLPAAEASATAVAYGQIRGGAVSLFEMKRMIERDCIARALSETRGNITRAAALLGMKRPRLSQLVKHYGLSALFTEGS